MWLFTKCGFFSAVQHMEDPEMIHVRARFEGDLQRLCRKHGVRSRVKMTPGNDYRYRMDFDRNVWAHIVEAEAMGVDYENFKNEVHDGTERDAAYMEVWAAMRGAQMGW